MVFHTSTTRRKNVFGDGIVLATQYAIDLKYPDSMKVSKINTTKTNKNATHTTNEMTKTTPVSKGIEWAPSMSSGVQAEYIEMAKRYIAQCR